MIIEKLEEILKQVFTELGYKLEKVRVIKSNRPDLCDYQCDDIFGGGLFTGDRNSVVFYAYLFGSFQIHRLCG